MMLRFLLSSFFLLTGILVAQTQDLPLRDTTTAQQLLYETDSLIKIQKLGEAFETLERSRKIFTALFGTKSSQVAQCWKLRTIIAFHQKNDEALKMALDSSMAIQKSLLEDTHPEIAFLHNAMGVYYMNVGRYDEAAKEYKRALEITIHNKGAFDSNVATSYNNLGIVYKNQGQFYRAVQHYHKALEIWEKLDTNGVNLASAYNNLGVLHNVLKQYETAVDYLNRALQIRMANFGEHSPYVAEVYNNLGIAHAEQDFHEEALEYYQASLDIWLQHEIPHQRFQILNNISNVYKKKEEYEKALRYSDQALEVILQSVYNNHPEVAGAYYGRSEILFKQGKYEQAMELLERALQKLNYTDSGSLAYVTSLPFLIPALNTMNEVQIQQFLQDQQVTRLQENKERTLEALEALNYQYGLITDNAKAQLGERAFNTYDNAITTNYLLYETDRDPRHLTEAFSFSEKAKSYRLYEAMQEAHALAFAGLPEELLSRESELSENIAHYDKKRRQAIIEGKDLTDPDILTINGKLFELNQAYNTLKAQLERDYPQYYELKYDLSTIDVNELQNSLLEKDQSLLEYFVGKNMIHVFVINKDTFFTEKIDKDFPLEDWVDDMRSALDQDGFMVNIPQYNQTAHDLYERIFAPVANHLRERLIIVPDGILGYVPFEALLTKPIERSNRFRTYPYLLHKHQISYCYSATLLRQMKNKEHKKEKSSSLIAFAPFFEGDTIALASRFRYADDEDQLPLKPLTNSGEEVYGIRAITDGKIYVHQQATRQRFKDQADDYRIIHLATHGKADDKVGDFCFLAFSKQGNDIENALLYVKDLYNLQLNADMVVLSACETGIGELQKGEGIISLARGFTYAGAKSIVTSLWSLEESATKDLMISFYENLKKGLTKDRALWQAKRQFINDEGKKHHEVHPLFWSGFIGIGDMRNIDF